MKLSLTPSSAILTGMAFFVMGSNYWGHCYALGLCFFSLATALPLDRTSARIRRDVGHRFPGDGSASAPARADGRNRPGRGRPGGAALPARIRRTPWKSAAWAGPA